MNKQGLADISLFQSLEQRNGSCPGNSCGHKPVSRLNARSNEKPVAVGSSYDPFSSPDSSEVVIHNVDIPLAVVAKMARNTELDQLCKILREAGMFKKVDAFMTGRRITGLDDLILFLRYGIGEQASQVQGSSGASGASSASSASGASGVAEPVARTAPKQGVPKESSRAFAVGAADVPWFGGVLGPIRKWRHINRLTKQANKEYDAAVSQLEELMDKHGLGDASDEELANNPVTAAAFARFAAARDNTYLTKVV